MASAIKVAINYANAGRSVMPTGAKGKDGRMKSPYLPSWLPLQANRANEDAIKKWEKEYHPSLWGMITGVVSGVFVIDCDAEEALKIMQDGGLLPHVKTKKGYHFYFKHPGHPVITKAGLLPHLDIRGDGGFVNFAGANDDAEYETLIFPDDETLYDVAQLPDQVKNAGIYQPDHKASPAPINKISIPKSPGIYADILKRALEQAGNGTRNQTGLWLACQLRDNGLAQLDCEPYMFEFEGRVRDLGNPPYEIDEAMASLAQAFTRAPREPSYRNAESPPISPPSTIRSMHVSTVTSNCDGTERHKNGTDNVTDSAQKTDVGEKTSQDDIPLSQRIEDWIVATTAWWSNEELDRDLGIKTEKDKHNRRMILSRFKAQGRIEAHQKQNKMWRFVNTKKTDILYKNVAPGQIIPITWPLGIEKYVNLHPGNLVVVAGAPESGKTALLLSFIRRNQDKFAIHYFCSEMGEEGEELRDRLDLFGDIAIDDWTFEAHEQSSNFEDVIVPDCINIIDFMELTEEMYTVNTHLTALSHKIGRGLCVVALQKKIGERLGRGQEFSLEKPRLYLSMDKGKITIIKGKSWANRKVDPHNLSCRFKIIDGCKFTITEEWDWPKSY